MIRIECFGRLIVTREGDATPITITHRRQLGLLAVLAAAGDRGLSRDALILMLWPDSKADRGRHSLSQAMYALRRELGVESLFVAGADTVRLNSAVVKTDVAAVESALARRDVAGVTTVYRAPLLEGFTIADAHELEEWIAEQREALLARVLALLEDTPDSDLSYRELIRGWRRVAVAERGNERVERGMTRALDKAPRGPAVDLVQAEGPPGEGPAAVARIPAGRLLPRRAMAIAAAILTIVAITTLAIRHPWTNPAATDGDELVIAIAPFTAADTSVVFWREATVDLLSHELDGAGRIRTIAPGVVLSHWSGSPGAQSPLALARTTNAKLVVMGTVLRLGHDSVSTVAAIYDGESGKTIADLPDRRDANDRTQRLIDSLAIDILREIAARFPVAAVRSPTLYAASNFGATKAFLQGEQAYRRAQWGLARQLYSEALRLDSSFAPAHRRLGSTLGFFRFGIDTEATAHQLRGGALNHHFSRRDSLLLLADSLQAAGEGAPTARTRWRLADRLFAVTKEAVSLYPDDPEAFLALGEAQFHFGDGPRHSLSAVVELQPFDSAIRLDSGFALGYQHAMQLALETAGPERAIAYGRAFQRHFPENANHSIILALRVLEAHGELTKLHTLVESSPRDVVNSAYNILSRWADSAESARWLVEHIESARSTDPNGEIALPAIQRHVAEQLAYRGHLVESRRTIGNAGGSIANDLCYLGAIGLIPGTKSCDVETLSALRLVLPALGTAGDTAGLQRFLKRVAAEAAASHDTSGDARALAAYDSLATHAFLALARHDSVGALRILVALPDTTCVNCYLHRFTRARLLAAANRPEAALRDLEENAPGLLSPLEVLCAYWVARTARGMGSAAIARAKYTIVRDAWAGGDPTLQQFVDEARGYLAK